MTVKLPKNCRLLGALDDKELARALAFFDARESSYEKGEFLHVAGTPFPDFGILLSGTLSVFMEDIEGARMIMAAVLPGESFGESLAYLGVREPQIYVEATEYSRVLWCSPAGLRTHGAEESALAARFTAMLADKMLASNDRVQVLSKTTLKRKLMTLFTQYVRRGGSYSFTLPFDRAGMAAYLGSDRAALSRELSVLQKEGYVHYEGNRFTVFPEKMAEFD